jgi:hypothetical protein
VGSREIKLLIPEHILLEKVGHSVQIETGTDQMVGRKNQQKLAA